MMKSRFRTRREENTSDIPKPQLTSLIDVMTLLLVFLFQSFSTESNLVKVPDQVELSQIKKGEKVPTAMNLVLSSEGIMLEGKKVLDWGTETLDEKEAKVLQAKLELTKKKNQRVLIYCEKELDFARVKEVLRVCSQAKIKNFSLLVKEG